MFQDLLPTMHTAPKKILTLPLDSHTFFETISHEFFLRECYLQTPKPKTKNLQNHIYNSPQSKTFNYGLLTHKKTAKIEVWLWYKVLFKNLNLKEFYQRLSYTLRLIQCIYFNGNSNYIIYYSNLITVG